VLSGKTLCKELDLPSIKILFHIRSAFNDTHAAANGILILTFYSDFDTFLQAQPINGLLKFRFYITIFCCSRLFPSQLFTYGLSPIQQVDIEMASSAVIFGTF
jgi:hypothetical protein